MKLSGPSHRLFPDETGQGSARTIRQEMTVELEQAKARIADLEADKTALVRQADEPRPELDRAHLSGATAC
jgi:hypothetical protein